MAVGLEGVAVSGGLAKLELAALLAVAGDDGNCVAVELDGFCVVVDVVLGTDCPNCAPVSGGLID